MYLNSPLNFWIFFIKTETLIYLLNVVKMVFSKQKKHTNIKHIGKTEWKKQTQSWSKNILSNFINRCRLVRVLDYKMKNKQTNTQNTKIAAIVFFSKLHTTTRQKLWLQGTHRRNARVPC